MLMYDVRMRACAPLREISCMRVHMSGYLFPCLYLLHYPHDARAYRSPSAPPSEAAQFWLGQLPCLVAEAATVQVPE